MLGGDGFRRTECSGDEDESLWSSLLSSPDEDLRDLCLPLSGLNSLMTFLGWTSDNGLMNEDEEAAETVSDRGLFAGFGGETGVSSSSATVVLGRFAA
jgi:hypothetical protein